MNWLQSLWQWITGRIVISAIVAILVTGTLGFAIYKVFIAPDPVKTSIPQGATSPQAQTTPTPGTAATSPGVHRVGDVVIVDTWVMTIDKVSVAVAANTAHTADLFINFTVENTTATEQTFSPATQCLLRDPSGQTYALAHVTFPPTAPEGLIPSGAAVQGTLLYRIPMNLTQSAFTFVFKPNPQASQQAEWTLQG